MKITIDDTIIILEKDGITITLLYDREYTLKELEDIFNKSLEYKED